MTNIIDSRGESVKRKNLRCHKHKYEGTLDSLVVIGKMFRHHLDVASIDKKHTKVE